MIPGYYAVRRDAVLTIGSKRNPLRRGDWLVTDGQYIGVFDKVSAMDWLPLENASGQPLLLTEVATAQLQPVVVPVKFAQLERRLQQQLATHDSGLIPDMPKAPIRALGPYLRSHRTLVAYTYQR